MRFPYAVAIAFVAAAAIVRLVFLQDLGQRVAFVTFYPAVMAAALYGGLWPGLLASVLSVLAVGYFWLEPVGQFAIADSADMLALVVFLLSCAMVSGLAEAMRRAQARALRAHNPALAAWHPVQNERRLHIREKRLADEQLKAIFPAKLVFPASLAMLAVLAFFSYRNTTAMLESGRWEEHAHQVIQELYRLQSALAEAEAEANHYFVTGDRQAGESYSRSAELVSRQLALLKRLADGDARQRQRLRALDAPVRDLLAGLELAIAGRQPESAMDIGQQMAVSAARGHMAVIGASVADLQDEERRMLQAHSTAKINRVNGVIHTGALGVLLSFALLILVYLALRREIAERVAAEAEVVNYGDRLKRIVDSVPQFIWTCLPEGQCDYSSPQWSSYTGLSEQETLGYGWMEPIHPDDQAALVAAWQVSLEQSGVFDMELRIRRADGAYRWFKTQASPQCDSTGKLVKWFCSCTDIDDLRRAEQELARHRDSLEAQIQVRTAALEQEIAQHQAVEQALRENEERMRLVLEASSMGTFEVDLATGQGRWNPVEYKLLGLKPGSAPARAETFFRHVHPDDAGLLKARWEEALRTGQLDTEFRIIRANGEERWLASRGSFALGEEDTASGPRRFLGVNFDITERKRAEAALRESQRQNEFLADILENCSQPFGLRHPNQRYGLTNKSFQRLTGYSAEELKAPGRLVDLTPPEWQAFEAEKLAELERTGQPVRYEKEYIRKDGSRVPVELLVSIVRDGDGNTAYYYAFMTDISVRKQAEEALRQSQADLNRAQAVAHTGSWRLDVHQNKLSWSEENYRIFGIRPGTAQNYESFLAAVHPDDRDFVDQAWREALAGKPYDIEHRIVVGDTVKWVRERAELEFGEDGTLLGGFGTTQDISELKSSQQSLQQERAFLRQVLDAVPSLIFVKDREGRFLLANAALAYCYGTTPDAIVGKSDADFNPNAEEVAHFRRNDLEVINSGKTKLIAAEQVSQADGTVHWFSTVKVPLPGENGVCGKLLGVATDITERKRAEEALQEADRRKDEFLAMLAHELRNPLTPMAMAAQLLQERGTEDPSLAQWAGGMVKRQCDNLTQLVNQLLDVSRVTQGKITLNKLPLDLRESVQRAAESCKSLIDKHRHTLTVVPPPEALRVEADPVRIEQVIGNLLNNAAKYTPDGGQIQVTLEREAGAAVLRVRDNGIGISDAMLPGVFELFAQAERTLDRAQGGLGIGLALVKSLVEMHGGSVKAASAGIGLGSEFEVRLPLLAQVPTKQAAPPAVPGQTAAKARRLLVVDDNDDVRASTALLLRSQGHDVWEAANGAEALNIAKAQRPDAVLLDIGMPGMNGYEAARLMRQDPALANVVLIAMTGYSQEYDRQESRRAGFNRHAVKPLAPAELADLLAELEALTSE